MKTKYSALLVLGTSLLLSSCGCSNNPDKNILNDVNEAIAKSENPVNTCYDAVQVALAAGIDLENYQFTDKNYCFAFDIDTKQFVIMNDDNIVYSPRKYKKNKNTYSYFKFTNAYDAKSIYSQYLTSDFAGADLLVATTGLDMGVNRNVKTIMYNNTTGNAKTVHLRMFCDYLNINAVTDTVNLYYAATNVYVTQVKELYECATASSAYVQVSMGDVYFKPNCSIDLFEVPEKANVTTHYEEGANVYGAINADNVPTLRDIHMKEVTSKEDFESSYCNFFRLMNDVTFDDNKYLSIKNTCCIDLNGKKLSFKYDERKTYESTNINGSIVLDAMEVKEDIYCYILDSQSTVYQRSGIYEENCAIISRGTDKYEAGLIINGGKITANRTPCAGAMCGDPAIISIGQNQNGSWVKKEERSNDNISKSTIKMYGGYINIFENPGTTELHAGIKALQPKGYGASVFVYYGDIKSDGYCISGMGDRDDQYGGTNIEVTSGTFTSPITDVEPTDSDRGYSNLFFPQGGNVTINGGKFIGTTCLNAKSGKINIRNAKFEAVGEYFNEEGACTNGVFSDGSVFTIESNEARYETKEDDESCLNISVSNCSLTSRQGYVSRFLGIKENGSGSGHDKLPKVFLNINNCQGYYKLGESEIFDPDEDIKNELKEKVFYTESDNNWTKLENNQGGAL